MTQTTDNGTALAVREYTDAALKQRIRLNQQARYGLQEASPAALNIIFLMCQRYDLDPVSDITLFEGRPFITIDGRLRLLRRHPEYRGYNCRPLTKDEKEAWGYELQDIVVECTIRTTTWGDISTRGKVTAIEVQDARERAQRSGKRSAPIGVHPVEIAEKRAIARAERAAFGQESLPDDDEITQAVTSVIEERNDPERIARNAAEYDRVIGANYDDEPASAGTDHARESGVPEAIPTSGTSPEPEMVRSTSSPKWKQWQAAVKQAHEAEIEVPALDLPIEAGSLEASTRTLLEMVAEARAPAQVEF